MDRNSLQRSLDANDAFYARMFKPAPKLSPRVQIRFTHKQIVEHFWREIAILDARIRRHEESFGHYHKYDADEPRLPAGDSHGGEWTDGGGGGIDNPGNGLPKLPDRIDEYPPSKPGIILNDMDGGGDEGGDGGGDDGGDGGVFGDGGEDPLEGIDQDILDTWGDYDTLLRHYMDHADDFGATSPGDYASQANGFYQRFQEENLPAIAYPKDGKIAVYDPGSNAFGVYNPDGTTSIFYKPINGAEYFQELTDTQLSRGGRIINPLPDSTGNTGGGGVGGGIDRPGGVFHQNPFTGEIEE